MGNVKAKDALREKFNREMAILARREKMFTDGLNYYNEARSEFKRTKSKLLNVTDVMIELHEKKLEDIRAKREELAAQQMSVMQEFAVEGLSNVEIEIADDIEFYSKQTKQQVIQEIDEFMEKRI